MLTLNALPRLHGDPARARRIRQRCHRALGPSGGSRPAARTLTTVGSRFIEPALIGSLGAVYLLEVLRCALLVYGR